MALFRVNDIRKMSREERRKKLNELRVELIRLRLMAARGNLQDTGKFREIKKAIARILTVEREEELKVKRGAGKHK